MFQLPVLGSCCILKLSNDIPKLPNILFPSSFNFPKASSFILFMRSSYSFCNLVLNNRLDSLHFKQKEHTL